MRRLAGLWLAIALLLLAPGASAETRWSIGPSIGFDMTTTEGQTIGILGAPAGPSLFALGAVPGLRIGAAGESQRHAVFLDTGYQVLSSAGSSLHVMSGTVNYAYYFGSGTAPYVTAGGGFTHVGFDATSWTLALYGGGAGIRHRLAHGHGAIRLEASYHHAANFEEPSSPLDTIGIRVGFDLDLN